MAGPAADLVPVANDPQQTLLPRRREILPFRFRLPLTRQLLRFGDLCRGHLLRDFISIADRILVTSRGRQTEPHVCLNIVFRHAQSRSVTEAKIDLRSNMTLVCSAAKPLRSLGPVLGHGDAREVQDPDVELRAIVTALGGKVIQLQCFSFVLRHPIAVVVQGPQVVLGEGIALIGNVNAMFTNLSRRRQGLIQRQLSLISELESREADPDQLSSLFKLDHLATRMRRNGENLLVLAGEEPGRRWTRPVPLVDVLRAAASEVEQYERIELTSVPATEVAGRVVNDLVHLLAELLENATSFSSPQTKVKVTGHALPDGRVLIEIHDTGIGLSPEDLAAINERLASPPTVDVSVSRRMGLFVVGRLSLRHGIRIQLRPSDSGGTTALVMLPVDVAQGGKQAGARRARSGQAPRAAPAAPAAGRRAAARRLGGATARSPAATAGAGGGVLASRAARQRAAASADPRRRRGAPGAGPGAPAGRARRRAGPAPRRPRRLGAPGAGRPPHGPAGHGTPCRARTQRGPSAGRTPRRPRRRRRRPPTARAAAQPSAAAAGPPGAVRGARPPARNPSRACPAGARPRTRGRRAGAPAATPRAATRSRDHRPVRRGRGSATGAGPGATAECPRPRLDPASGPGPRRPGRSRPDVRPEPGRSPRHRRASAAGHR